MTNKDQDEVEERFIEVMREIFVRKGYDDLTAKILAALFLEPEPISMEEVAEQTGYSPASISLKIKSLSGPISAMVTKTTKPGSKKVYVYMGKFDIENQFLEKVKNGYESISKFAKDNLPKILAEYKNKTVTPERKKKIRIIENYLKTLDDFDEIIACVSKKIADIRSRSH